MSDKQLQKAGDNSTQVQMVNPTFICESAGTQIEDSLTMKNILNSFNL